MLVSHEGGALMYIKTSPKTGTGNRPLFHNVKMKEKYMKFISTPVKGMQDFLPEDMRLRQHVLGLIRRTYATYGFEEIETPAMEHIENLTGKVGGENEKLIFKVMKRGRELEKGLETGEIADSALRYDRQRVEGRQAPEGQVPPVYPV